MNLLVVFLLVRFVTLVNCEFNFTSEKRIVNGVPAKIEDYPFVVYIVEFSFLTREYTRICTGSFLNTRWVLTAAHCITSYGSPDPENRNGWIGILWEQSEMNLDPEPINSWSGLFPNPDYKYVPHHEINKAINDHDIGLMKLAREVTFNERASAVELPPANVHRYWTYATLLGFGTIGVGIENRRLRKGKFKIVDKSHCETFYGEKFTSSRTKICAYGQPPHKIQPCYGDSGGPLIMKMGGKTYIIGITTTAYPDGGCGIYAGAPQLFVKVAAYVDWIKWTMYKWRDKDPRDPHDELGA